MKYNFLCTSCCTTWIHAIPVVLFGFLPNIIEVLCKMGPLDRSNMCPLLLGATHSLMTILILRQKTISFLVLKKLWYQCFKPFPYTINLLEFARCWWGHSFYRKTKEVISYFCYLNYGTACKNLSFHTLYYSFYNTYSLWTLNIIFLIEIIILCVIIAEKS